jgi:osmoprotectant transport system substrate-binding protein
VRWRVAVAVAGVTLLAVASCGPSSGATPSTILHDRVVTIGAFNFPESDLLARLYAMALERDGFRVDLKLDLGPRELVDPALQRGLLELVPEYAGSALTFFGGTPSGGPAETHDALGAAARERGLVALDAAPAQDRDGFVVTAATARLYALQKLSDLAPYASRLVFGGPPECASRPLCLQGLHSLYGLDFESFVPLDTGGPITVSALKSGEVNVALLFTTDGSIDNDGFVLLRDDRRLEPAENVTPLVRPELEQTFGPRLTATVNAVSRQLTTEDLRAMNARIQQGASPGSVARGWLDVHGIGTD